MDIENDSEQYSMNRHSKNISMDHDKKNIVFIVVDSLRADYLSSYGSNLETPSFEEIADKGITFRNMYASGPNTPISHSAMFSGKYPSETGVVLSRIQVPGNIPLISSWLQKHGYYTVGFSGPSVMGSEFGFDRGFDKYYEPYKYSPKNIIKHLTRAIKNKPIKKPMIKSLLSFMIEGFDDYTKLKIDSLEYHLTNPKKPVFFMANLMTPHHPYFPPRPYMEESNSSVDRPTWGILEEMGADIKVNNEHVREERLLQHGRIEEMARYLADPSFFREEELDVLSDWYHGAIRYTGDQLLKMVRKVRETIGLDDTVIVITSDHGDFFGEYDLISHSQFLHEEVTRVPLFILGTDLPQGVIRKRLASHIDLFDTICDIVDVPPPDSTSGISLLGEQKNDVVISEHGEWRQMRNEGAGKVKYMGADQASQFTVGRKTARSRNYRYEIDSDGNEKYYTRPNDIEISDGHGPEWLRDKLIETVGSEFNKRLERDNNLNSEIKANLKTLGYME